MSMPGWYPDPAGVPNRFRFWDGTTWSEQTSFDPTVPPPSKQTSPGANPPSSRLSGKGWLLIFISIALASALIIWLVLQSTGLGFRRSGSTSEDWNSSAPSISAWDESSTSPPPPQPSEGGLSVDCPRTKVPTKTTQRTDGRIRGGGLAISKINRWTDEQIELQWVSDYAGQVDTVYPLWMSNVGVGALNHEDGFKEPRKSATQTVQCFASSGYYSDFTGREDLLDESISVDGRPAWHIRSNVFVSNPRLPQVKGDTVDIIVVDLGPEADHLGLFISSVTIDDTRRRAQVDKVIASLKLA